MKTFDVQAVEIRRPQRQVFDFVRDPKNLPSWAHAFREANDSTATLTTPSGAVDVGLRTDASIEAGTIDWRLTFPDGNVGIAQSRATETARGSCIYSFVLHAPPVPLEQLEGALEAQSVTLRSELAALKSILEQR
jgi:hypothetical protein